MIDRDMHSGRVMEVLQAVRRGEELYETDSMTIDIGYVQICSVVERAAEGATTNENM